MSQVHNEAIIDLNCACDIFDILVCHDEYGRLTLKQLYEGLTTSSEVKALLSSANVSKSSLALFLDADHCESLLNRIKIYNLESSIDKNAWVELIGDMILNDIEYLRMQGLSRYRTFWGRYYQNSYMIEDLLNDNRFPPLSWLEDFIYYERNHHPLLALSFYADEITPMSKRYIFLIEAVIHCVCIYYASETYVGSDLYVAVLLQAVTVGIPTIIIRRLYTRFYICTNKSFPKQHLAYSNANSQMLNGFVFDNTDPKKKGQQMLNALDDNYINRGNVFNNSNQLCKIIISLILLLGAVSSLVYVMVNKVIGELHPKTSYILYTLYVIYSLLQLNFLPIIYDVTFAFNPFKVVVVFRKIWIIGQIMAVLQMGKWMYERDVVLQYCNSNSARLISRKSRITDIESPLQIPIIIEKITNEL